MIPVLILFSLQAKTQTKIINLEPPKALLINSGKSCYVGQLESLNMSDSCHNEGNPEGGGKTRGTKKLVLSIMLLSAPLTYPTFYTAVPRKQRGSTLA